MPLLVLVVLFFYKQYSKIFSKPVIQYQQLSIAQPSNVSLHLNK